MRKIKKADLLLGITGFLILFAVWQLISTVIVNKNALPSPFLVLADFVKSFLEPIGSWTLPGHIVMSLQRVLVGFGAASLLGICLGLFMASSEAVDAVVKPLFELFRPIPPLAWIPMAIIWFGIGEMTKYFIIFMSAFFTVTLNAYTGAKNVDPILVGAGRMLGANERQLFLTVIFRGAVPQIFAGLQVALSSSWMAVLAAEMVRSMDGVGWVIIRGMEVGDTVQIMVGMAAIALVGFLLTQLMRVLEGGLCKWNRRGM